MLLAVISIRRGCMVFIDQARAGSRLVHAWFLEIALARASVCVCSGVYACVCPEAINNYSACICCDTDRVGLVKFYGFFRFSVALYDTCLDKMYGRGLSNTGRCERQP